VSESYAELLRRPEWQWKRLERLKGADFQCEECKEFSRNLRLDIRRHIPGTKPWDYEYDDYICVCEECAKGRDFLLNAIRKDIGRLSLSDLAKVFQIVSLRGRK